MTVPPDQDPVDPLSQPPPPPDWSTAGGPEVPPPPRRRFYPVAFVLGFVAWAYIVWTVAAALVWPHGTEDAAKEATANAATNTLLMRFQARYLVGVRELAPASAGTAGQLFAQAKTLNVGPIDQRLRFVVLAGELDGPDTAAAQLGELDGLIARRQITLTDQQKESRATLGKLYADYQRLHFDAPTVTPPEKQQLREDLGWFGDLALAPAGAEGLREAAAAVAGGPAAANMPNETGDQAARQQVLWPAKRVVVTALSALVIVLGLLFLGCCGLLLLFVLLLLDKLRGGLICGLSPAGVYAETFALWMLLFRGLGWLFSEIPLGRFRLLAGGVGTLLTLVVLVWPILRGVTWRQLRSDLGWTLGRRPAVEPVIGVGCYTLAMPMLLVGLVLVLVVTGVQSFLGGGGASPDDLVGPTTPSHPIVAPLARGGWDLRLQVFFLASIVAPIVEETMFRGVLYRHLRELTHRFSAAASIILSALVSSFVFAAIHPQGLAAIPLLMALACGFVLAREWRGTLVPAMVAHGLNNALVLLLSVTLLGD